MRTTRRHLLAAALAGAGTVAAYGLPAAAIPREVDHVQFWNTVLARRVTDPALRAAVQPVLDTALHDTAVSLGAPGTPVVARAPKLPNWNYDRDMNLDAAAYAVLRALVPGVDFSRDFAAARATPPLGEPGPEGWSVSVGEGAARQAIAARDAG
jgi:hypothetical protein